MSVFFVVQTAMALKVKKLNTSSKLGKKNFAQSLIAWYNQYQRNLPWRESPSLYKTVVSEFMLQQTKVETVLPYFEKWLKKFPDFRQLAAASEDEVLKQWEGLGYYSRARNLRKLAIELNKQTEIPTNAKDWQSFPGIGPYSAAAITSISFESPTAVVDGNVIRILTRLSANQQAFKDNSAAVKSLTPLALELLPEKNIGDYNQAVMELGATICYRKKPLCTVCPVLEFCKAGKQGDPETYPKLIRKKTEHISLDRLWIQHYDSLLLKQQHHFSRRLANIFELPQWSDLTPRQAKSKNNLIITKTRAISNQRITENIYRITPTPYLLNKIRKQPELQFIPVNQLQDITLSGPHRKWTTQILKS